mgnify:CR=1 FL=1
MGPTNNALVRLFHADQQLAAAEERLRTESSSLRQHERRIADLEERQRLVHAKLMEQQSRDKQLELEIRAREEKIARFRTQQQEARTHKEYQAFVAEINAEKAQKAKLEDEKLEAMEQIEKIQAENESLLKQMAAEREKHAQLSERMSSRLAELQAEIDRLRPVSREARAGVPAKALEVYDRVSERYDGEAMSRIVKPNPRYEQYACGACNMSLVPDVYNKLHSRDEIIVCPSCRRLLYIPDDLPPEAAIRKVKERKAPRKKAPPAAVNRQTSAVDVLRSMTPEEAEPPTPETSGANPQAAAAPADAPAGEDGASASAKSAAPSAEPTHT